MKILYDIKNQNIIWQGKDYTVDGKQYELPEGIVLLECVTADLPEYEPDTQYLKPTQIIDLIKKQYITSFEIVNYTKQELFDKDWIHTQYSKRLTISQSVIFSQEGSSFYALLTLEGLPIEKREDKIVVWCNKIEAAHQDFFDQLKSQGLLTEEEYKKW